MNDFPVYPRASEAPCSLTDMEPLDGDLAADMEMTSEEAAAYLSGPIGFPLTTKALRGLRYLRRGPVVEKRGSRLVYRKSALDAFLRENGTDPMAWMAGTWREVADRLRTLDEGSGAFDPVIQNLERRDPPPDWDPEQAR